MPPSPGVVFDVDASSERYRLTQFNVSMFIES